MRVWFDLTDIYDWQGHFTGIQRVVYNLAHNLTGSELDVHYFVYKSGIFNEVSLESLETRLEAAKSHGAQGDSAGVNKAAYFRYHGIIALKQSVRGTRAEPVARATYNALRTTYRKTKSSKALHSNNRNQPFAPEDTVLVCGGNWHIRGYADAITEARQQVGFRLVHFVNDLIALKNPALVNAGAEKIIGAYFRMIFSGSDDLIAISQSTKRDIEWFMGASSLDNRLNIHVIRLGDNLGTLGKGLKSKQPATAIPAPYILSVGTLEIRKNYRLLYYAYKLALQDNIQLPHLVIVGKKGWMIGETYSLLTEDPDIKDRITILNSASDEELRWLYDHCEFSVFPSMYEGWGLPVSESFVHGKCCITTNVSSMPEAGGTLAVYVSPYDPGSLLKAIADLHDAQTRSKLEAKIEKDYVGQSWSKATEQLIHILGSA